MKLGRLLPEENILWTLSFPEPPVMGMGAIYMNQICPLGSGLGSRDLDSKAGSFAF